MTERHRIHRVPGRTVAESASCDELECEWAYEGEHAIRQARAHTDRSGHDTVVWSNVTAWYSRGRAID